MWSIWDTKRRRIESSVLATTSPSPSAGQSCQTLSRSALPDPQQVSLTRPSACQPCQTLSMSALPDPQQVSLARSSACQPCQTLSMSALPDPQQISLARSSACQPCQTLSRSALPDPQQVSLARPSACQPCQTLSRLALPDLQHVSLASSSAGKPCQILSLSQCESNSLCMKRLPAMGCLYESSRPFLVKVLQLKFFFHHKQIFWKKLQKTAAKSTVPYFKSWLKGTMSRDFLFSFFHESSSPNRLKIPLGSFLNFSNIPRDILQIKVHQRYHWHQWQICHQCQCHQLQVCHLYQRHRPLICHWYHWCQRHRGYILGTISDCLHLKVNLKKKNVNSTTQRCPNKIFKTFLIEDFFHLPTVSGHRWCTLSCEYLREIGKTFKITLKGILRRLGETASWKNWSRKSRDTVPLNMLRRRCSRNRSIFKKSRHLRLEPISYLVQECWSMS